jgi:adenylate kinase family enzyme
MQKVAVFGNTGGGKSTLSKRLSDITGLPLHILDKIQYRSGGAEVPQEDYKRAHQEILQTERWVIDGFGCLETLWRRLDEADTLVFIDLPLYVHFWWVTKRLISGYFKPPAGWPENTPILKSSITSYRVLWLCDKYLSPKYREYVDRARSTKSVYHITSTEQISQFFASIENEFNFEDGAAASPAD